MKRKRGAKHIGGRIFRVHKILCIAYANTYSPGGWLHTLNHSANSTFITTYSCIIIICTYCICSVYVLLWCHLIACEMYHCLLSRLLILMQNSRTQHTAHNTIQSAIRWVIHTHKNRTLDSWHTHTHTGAHTQETSSANDSSLLIIPKQMRTNGKSCYHRYVIEKEKRTRVSLGTWIRICRRAIAQGMNFFYHWIKEAVWCSRLFFGAAVLLYLAHSAQWILRNRAITYWKIVFKTACYACISKADKELIRSPTQCRR